MEDYKCVKQGVVQLDLGSYPNPVCTAQRKRSDQTFGYESEAKDEHDLLFRYHYCPKVGATARESVNLQIDSINVACVTSKMA
jgi:hypothetical protein